MDHMIDDISEAQLLPLVRHALNNPRVEIGDWSRESVRGGFGGAIGGTAIYRFSGKTDDNQPWSLILKVLYRRPNEDQHSPYYWKREYEVYRAGILEPMPPDSFSLPSIYGVADHGESCWIWMEDVEDIKDAWTLADYCNIAMHLGRFNGAFALACSLPDQEWLTRDWHCAIVPALADAFGALDDLLENPLARRCLPLEAWQRIDEIWRNRQRYIEALGQLPKTFCHIDAFRRNILHLQNDIVLLDWAVPGTAALGEDLVSLVAVSLHYSGFSASYARKLDNTVFDGYVTGLRQAGWRGDAVLARTGYVCAMVLRGLAGVKQDINLLSDHDNHETLISNHGCEHIEQVADFFAEIRRFRLLGMAKEADALLKIL